MKNRYKNRTKRLGIPVVGPKDHIWPEVEMKKWQLVENILLAVMGDTRNCVFAEGDFAIEKQTDGSYTAVLRAVQGGMPSVSGVVSGMFVEAPKVVRWEKMAPGGKYYLFIHVTRRTRTDPSAIRVTCSRFNAGSRSRMLMGVADLTGDEFTLDRHPDGKKYSTGLTIPGLVLSPQVIDFETGGQGEGILLEAAGKIVFVQVSSCHHPSMKAGEFSFGYHSTDEKVLRKNQVMVYNSGVIGLSVKALIFCE